MSEDKKVLVYFYHADGESLLPGKKSLEVIKNGQLEELLKEHPNLKLTRKPISPGAGSVEIHQKDLAQDPSIAHPNDEQNVAAVSLPWRVQLSNVLFEGYNELIILSRKVGGQGS